MSVLSLRGIVGKKERENNERISMFVRWCAFLWFREYCAVGSIQGAYFLVKRVVTTVMTLFSTCWKLGNSGGERSRVICESFLLFFGKSVLFHNLGEKFLKKNSLFSKFTVQ